MPNMSPGFQSQRATYCVRGNANKCAIDYSAADGATTSPDTFEIGAAGSKYHFKPDPFKNCSVINKRLEIIWEWIEMGRLNPYKAPYQSTI